MKFHELPVGARFRYIGGASLWEKIGEARARPLQSSDPVVMPRSTFLEPYGRAHQYIDPDEEVQIVGEEDQR